MCFFGFLVYVLTRSLLLLFFEASMSTTQGDMNNVKEDAVVKEDNIHVKFESCFKNGIGNDDSDDYADGAEFGSYEWVVNVTTSVSHSEDSMVGEFLFFDFHF